MFMLMCVAFEVSNPVNQDTLEDLKKKNPSVIRGITEVQICSINAKVQHEYNAEHSFAVLRFLMWYLQKPQRKIE